MSRPMRERLRIGAARQPTVLSLWLPAPEPGGATTATDAFEAWCATHPGARVEVWLAGGWLQNVVCDAALPLEEPAAVAAYVGRLLAHYQGGASTPAPVAVWVAGGRRGGCMLNGGLDPATLQAIARRHGVRLRSIGPAWWLQWQRARQAEPRLASAAEASLLVVEGAGLTWLGLEAGRLVTARQHRLDAPTREQLDDLVDGLAPRGAVFAIGFGLQQSETTEHRNGTSPSRGISRVISIGPLDGLAADLQPPAAPAGLLRHLRPGTATARAPDFLASTSQRLPTRLGVALAATGALTLLTAGLDAWDAHQARDAARLALAATSADGAGAAASGNRDETRRGLDRPPPRVDWEAVLGSVEASSVGGIRWTALEHDRRTGELRLAGVAPDTGRAAGVTEDLGRSRAWREVALARVQPAERGGGVEFELQARSRGLGGEAGP